MATFFRHDCTESRKLADWARKPLIKLLSCIKTDPADRIVLHGCAIHSTAINFTTGRCVLEGAHSLLEIAEFDFEMPAAIWKANRHHAASHLIHKGNASFDVIEKRSSFFEQFNQSLWWNFLRRLHEN